MKRQKVSGWREAWCVANRKRNTDKNVECVSKGNVNTVEENNRDAVKRYSYLIGDSKIYGYGILIYMN